jgi:signal transduction histidine kinase
MTRLALGYSSRRKFSKNVPIQKDSSKTGLLRHWHYRPMEGDMVQENAPTALTAGIHKGLFRKDRGGTNRAWHALLQQARHAERLRIARELHDTLLQGLLGASMQLCLVDDGLPTDSPAKPILRRALDLIRKGLDEGRGALLGLRSPELPDGSLEKALGDIRDSFAPECQTPLCIVILGKTRPLVPAVKEQIYWIAREALLNALRHSAASRIEAEIEYLPRRLRVVVRDDGIGIDPEALRAGRISHWGLTGMQERAASIGAKVRVWSKRGEGTEVEISLPIHGLETTAQRVSPN